jgi:hypothetical protein
MMLKHFEPKPMSTIELPFIRPPPVGVKMELVKYTDEEHDIDWDLKQGGAST